ncbi:hypothetical protein ABE66_14905 [Cytobacillus firmus]|nr:hypothetical protein [Cytobacillus firmus]
MVKLPNLAAAPRGSLVTPGQVASLYNVKARRRTKTKNATSSQKLTLSVVRCIAAVAFLVLWQRLCDPLPVGPN